MRAIRPADLRDEHGYTAEQREMFDEFTTFLVELLMVAFVSLIVSVGVFYEPSGASLDVCHPHEAGCA